MANVLIEENTLKAIADATRNISGSTDKMLMSSVSEKILNAVQIPTITLVDSAKRSGIKVNSFTIPSVEVDHPYNWSAGTGYNGSTYSYYVHKNITNVMTIEVPEGITQIHIEEINMNYVKRVSFEANWETYYGSLNSDISISSPYESTTRSDITINLPSNTTKFYISMEGRIDNTTYSSHSTATQEASKVTEICRMVIKNLTLK